jgi:hypothetical protein
VVQESKYAELKKHRNSLLKSGQLGDFADYTARHLLVAAGLSKLINKLQCLINMSISFILLLLLEEQPSRWNEQNTGPASGASDADIDDQQISTVDYI